MVAIQMLPAAWSPLGGIGLSVLCGGLLMIAATRARKDGDLYLSYGFAALGCFVLLPVFTVGQAIQMLDPCKALSGWLYVLSGCWI